MKTTSFTKKVHESTLFRHPFMTTRLGCRYLGWCRIEKEENYFKQSQRRLQMTEQMIQDVLVVSYDDLRMLPAA